MKYGQAIVLAFAFEDAAILPSAARARQWPTKFLHQFRKHC